MNALSANPAGLFLNKRLQKFDIWLRTNGGDEWSWNGGALRLFYHSNDGLGAQASCLPFASGARQTTVAGSYPEDQVIRSPRLRERRFTRSRSKQDACTPRANAANKHFTVLASVEIG